MQVHSGPRPDVRYQVQTGEKPTIVPPSQRHYDDPAMAELMRIRDKAMAAKAKRDAVKASEQANE